MNRYYRVPIDSSISRGTAVSCCRQASWPHGVDLPTVLICRWSSLSMATLGDYLIPKLWRSLLGSCQLVYRCYHEAIVDSLHGVMTRPARPSTARVSAGINVPAKSPVVYLQRGWISAVNLSCHSTPLMNIRLITFCS